MYAPSEAWGTWVGAVAQFGIALAIFHYTRKTSRADATRDFQELINEWNALVASTPDHMKAAAALREPVVGHPTDSIVFSYLNCMRAYHTMYREGLVSGESAEAHMRNAAHWLRNLPSEKIDAYLSRGYDNDFKLRVQEELRRTIQ